MTIKVIKKRSKAVVKKITCDNCGAVLEYAPIDVKERNGTDISGGPDGEKYIMCPECGTKVILESW